MPGSSTVRLFLALWPDSETRDALVTWQEAVIWPQGAKVTLGSNLHLTLQFIGGVPSERLPELRRVLAVKIPIIELELDQLEVWNRGIVVLVPSNIPHELAALSKRLGDALRAAGLETEERPFRPHVTLARRGASTQTPTVAPHPVRWRSTGYVLAQSAGGRYAVLENYPSETTPTTAG